MKTLLTDKTYNILKWVALVVLPALGSLYFALAGFWGFPYGEQIVANAKCLAQHLVDRGLRIVSGGTDCHLMVVDLRAKNIDGKTAATALEHAGIVCNFNAIPYDPNPPRRPSGIRLGTPSLTTRGLKEPEMALVADWIVRVLDAPDDEAVIANTAAEIKAFLQKYPYHHQG